MADTAAAERQAGFDVALAGDLAAVGAPAFSRDCIGCAGAVHLFEEQDDTWTQVETLTSPKATPGDRFGYSIALEDGTLFVGTPRGDGSDATFGGAAHVFEQTPTGWAHAATLEATDISLGDHFGIAVAAAGDTLVVGASEAQPHGHAHSEGAAYVFENTTDGWVQTSKLVPEDAPDWDLRRFGTDVSIDDGTILVGVHTDNTQARAAGAAYVFELGSSGWTQTQKLMASDPGISHFFGKSVSLQGQTALIGAPGGFSIAFPGAVYVFEATPDGWSETARLEGDGDPEDIFGTSLAFEGDLAVVGDLGNAEPDLPDPWGTASAPRQEDLRGAGAAFVFERTPAGWKKVAKLSAEDRETWATWAVEDEIVQRTLEEGCNPLCYLDNDWFGISVAIDGSRIMAGAHGDDVGGEDRVGSAALFEKVGILGAEDALGAEPVLKGANP